MIPAISKFVSVELNNTMPAELQNAVVAIGNFDGVHTGHQAVLDLTRDIAASENRPAVVMTFEPHPRSFFQPDIAVFRLSTAEQKDRILKNLKMSGVVVVPFDRELADTSAENFVSKILVEKLKVGHVVTGYNFHFGKARAGTPEFLQESGKKFAFGVTTVPSFGDEGGVSVSSSRIRELIEAGNVAEAAGLLGYRWSVEGVVGMGKKLGRTLGFPTANITLPGHARLANGIYAVRLRRENGVIHDGVASFGRRPTFDNGAELLETYIFDFDEEIYGEKITVSLFEYLRPEEKFQSADALIEQMIRDKAGSMALLAGIQPLSEIDRRLNFTGV